VRGRKKTFLEKNNETKKRKSLSREKTYDPKVKRQPQKLEGNIEKKIYINLNKMR